MNLVQYSLNYGHSEWVSICMRISALARLKEAAAGRSAPSISDFKLEKRLCVTGGLDRRGHLMNGPSGWLIVKRERSGGKLCHTVSISDSFASHAYCSDARRKVYTKYPWHDHFSFCRLACWHHGDPYLNWFSHSRRAENSHPITKWLSLQTCCIWTH